MKLFLVIPVNMLGSVETKSVGNPTDCNTGVIASTDIPENTITGPYPGEFKFGQNSTDDPKIDFIIEVKHKDGRITLDFEVSNQWTRYIQPARDRHEQNVEFYKGRNGHIFLRTARRIKMGEQLFAWYSESLARTNGVPFLSLQNIIGNQQYQCHMCQLSFRYPNPLKAHMIYSCKRQEPHIFRPYESSYGDYLTESCASSSHSNLMPPLSSTIDCSKYCRASHLQKSEKLLAESWMSSKMSTVSSNPLNLTVFNTDMNCRISPPYPVQILDHLQPQYFPFRHRDQGSSKLCYNLLLESSQPQRAEMNRKDFALNSRGHGITNRKNIVPLPSEVEGEPLDILPKALLTKCKSGHICIFCGKFYSRKYGLKIHLRTHTGYKPLKCKVCLRPFGDPSNLNKHVRLHAEGETPYRCEFCNKVLVRRRDLERHIRSRHPQEASCSDIDRKEEVEIEDDEIVVT